MNVSNHLTVLRAALRALIGRLSPFGRSKQPGQGKPTAVDPEVASTLRQLEEVLAQIDREFQLWKKDFALLEQAVYMGLYDQEDDRDELEGQPQTGLRSIRSGAPVPDARLSDQGHGLKTLSERLRRLIVAAESFRQQLWSLQNRAADKSSRIVDVIQPIQHRRD